MYICTFYDEKDGLGTWMNMATGLGPTLCENSKIYGKTLNINTVGNVIAHLGFPVTVKIQRTA